MSDSVARRPSLFGLGPGRSLIHFCYVCQSLINKFLNAFSFVGFCSVEIPLGVGCDAVHGEELSWLPTAIAKAGENLQSLPEDDVDLFILSVRQKQVLLVGIL